MGDSNWDLVVDLTAGDGKGLVKSYKPGYREVETGIYNVKITKTEYMASKKPEYANIREKGSVVFEVVHENDAYAGQKHTIYMGADVSVPKVKNGEDKGNNFLQSLWFALFRAVGVSAETLAAQPKNKINGTMFLGKTVPIFVQVAAPGVLEANGRKPFPSVNFIAPEDVPEVHAKLAATGGNVQAPVAAAPASVPVLGGPAMPQIAFQTPQPNLSSLAALTGGLPGSNGVPALKL